jgi:hypothetical protein
MLEKIEIRPARLIQCDNLTVDYGVVWKVCQGFEDKRILSVEGIPAPGEEIQLACRFHGESAIAIQLDFVDPL